MTTFLTSLVVEPRLADSLFVVSALSTAGYRVTAADFQQAKALLTFSPPHLLVADIRQGAFNGLHLVIRGRSISPRMAALVTTSYADPVLQREAESLGATFVLLPLSREELVAAAARTLSRRVEDTDPVPLPFERRQVERRQERSIAFVLERRVADRRISAVLSAR